MAATRQIHIIPPWGNPELVSSNAILLIEFPATEEFAYGISHTSFEQVVVCIHSGKVGKFWCKTSIFVLNRDGTITESVHHGNTPIEETILTDWQRWHYDRHIEPTLVEDDFAREYQQEYILSGKNQPIIDPEDSTYFDHTPSTTNGVVNNDTVIRVLDFDSTAVDRAKIGFKTGSQWSADVTVKQPTNPTNTTSGARQECFGLGLGWQQSRIEGSQVRLLGLSAFSEDL